MKKSDWKANMEDQQSLPSSGGPKSGERGPDSFVGRHRMEAAISLLQNQINHIQEELDQLETFGQSSIVCQELVSSVESIPDPFLPLNIGPEKAGWDRWFRGTHNSRRRWI